MCENLVRKYLEDGEWFLPAPCFGMAAWVSPDFYHCMQKLSRNKMLWHPQEVVNVKFKQLHWVLGGPHPTPRILKYDFSWLVHIHKQWCVYTVNTFIPSFLPSFIHSYIHTYIHTSIHQYINASIHQYINTSIHYSTLQYFTVLYSTLQYILQ